MLNGLGFELPLMTSFPETLNGSRMEVFFIARKVKLCESPSKAGGLPILIIDYFVIELLCEAGQGGTHLCSPYP